MIIFTDTILVYLSFLWWNKSFIRKFTLILLASSLSPQLTCASCFIYGTRQRFTVSRVASEAIYGGESESRIRSKPSRVRVESFEFTIYNQVESFFTSDSSQASQCKVRGQSTWDRVNESSYNFRFSRNICFQNVDVMVDEQLFMPDIFWHILDQGDYLVEWWDYDNRHGQYPAIPPPPLWSFTPLMLAFFECAFRSTTSAFTLARLLNGKCAISSMFSDILWPRASNFVLTWCEMAFSTKTKFGYSWWWKRGILIEDCRSVPSHKYLTINWGIKWKKKNNW